MRWILLLAAVAVLMAQTNSSVQMTRDVNGNAVTGLQITEAKTKTASETTEKLQSINGRLVPLERVEERVLKSDPAGKVIERIVKRYDQTGNPGPPEKTLIEEQTTPSGSTTRSTTYRGDLNGNMRVAERSVTETRLSSGGKSVETIVERPTLNGSLETVEKTSVQQTGSPDRYTQDVVTYRQGQNGFYPATRVVTEHTQQGAASSESAARYEVGSSGSLELHEQTVSRTVKRPDGSEVSQVDHFGKSVAGTVSESGSPLKMTERDIIERRPGSGGTVETLSVQRPSISDPNTLGSSRVVSETVCRGKCQ